MSKEEEILIAATPSDSVDDIVAMKFPVRVMPITTIDPMDRLFITGGGGKPEVVVWDVKGRRVPSKRPGLKNIISQFRTAFKKLATTSVTVEFYLSNIDNDGYKAICIDVHNTKAHSTAMYEGTYEQRLPVLEAFLSQCGFSNRNSIYGPCMKTFFNWEELWDDMFGGDGLCTQFPFVSIRSSDSPYKVGLDINWCIVSGSVLNSCQQAIVEVVDAKA